MPAMRQAECGGPAKDVPRSDRVADVERKPVALSSRVMTGVSVVIVAHFVAVIARILSPMSGPWVTREGPSMSTPPQFAYDMNRVVEPYLRSIKLTSNYHYEGNRPGRPAAKLMIRMKDPSGHEQTETILPDSKANRMVQNRQQRLARWLADDQPVAAPIGEMIAAPNANAPTTQIWEQVGNRQLRLATTPTHLIPRDRGVFRPSDWSLLVLRSYGRRLERKSGTGEPQLLRGTFEPIPPAVLFMDNLPRGAFEELVSDYGELPR